MKILLRFIPTVVVMGIIFYLSDQPGDFVQLPQITGFDKLLHLIAYFVLAAAFLYGLHPFTNRSRRVLIVVIVASFCALFGVSDEFHQAFIPGRNVSGWDVVADACGGLFAAALWYRWRASRPTGN